MNWFSKIKKDILIFKLIIWELSKLFASFFSKPFLYFVLLMTSTYPLFVSAKPLSVFADYLYWHASQQTTSMWALTTRNVNNNTNIHVSNLDFAWNSGYRTGLIFEPDCHFFDARAYWTHFRARKNPDIPVSAQIISPQFFSGFLSSNFFFGATLDWILNKNVFDFEIGRKLFLTENECLMLRPSIGLKAASINQTIHAEWDAIFFKSKERVENNFLGVGPSLGLDVKWNLYKNSNFMTDFNLMADFSTGFLYGTWEIEDTYSRPEFLPLLVTPTTITTSMLHTNLCTLMTKCRIGFEWIFQGKFNTTIQLGYEMQYWPNQLRMPTFQQLPVHGDLTFQGGTCRIIIDL